MTVLVISPDRCSVGEPVLRVTLAVLAADSGLCLCCRKAGVTHIEEQSSHLPLIKSQISQHHKGLPRGEQSIVGAINVSHSGDAVDE